MKKFVAVVLSAVLVSALCTVSASASETLSWLKLPYTYAPGYNEVPTVSVFGNGVTNGEKILGSKTESVSYTNGQAADLLTDGYHATFSESKHIAVCGIGENGDSRDPVKANASASNNTGKMMKFSNVDSGIEIRFTKAEKVSSLHLWAWPANAIGDYEVLAEDGGEWTTILSGNLEDSRNDVLQTDCSTFYPLLFDKDYNTTALRFVIKSFGSKASAYGAHLVEAVPRPTNEINMTSVNPMRSLNQELSDTTNTSYSLYFDTYVVAGYGWNEENVETGKNGLTANCRRAGIFNNSNQFGKDKNGSTTEGYPVNYPAYDTRVINPANRTNAPKNGYYAVASLGGTRKINRISFLTSNINALKGMELFCTDDAATWDSLANKGVYKDSELDSKWKKVLTVKGSFENNTVYTYDIANAPSAKYWAVRYLADSHTVISNTAMYSLREDELLPYAAAVSNALANVFEGAAAVDSLNLQSSVNDGKGGSISLTWECDSDLVDCITGKITAPQNDTEVTLKAKADINGRTYILSGKVSLFGMDTRRKVVLTNALFDTLGDFSETTGNIAANNGAAILKDKATASFSLQPKHDFSFSGKSTLELELDSSTNGGTISLENGGVKLLDISLVNGGDIVVDYKNKSYEHDFTQGMKLELSENSFHLYLKEKDKWVLRVYQGEFYTEGMATEMKLTTKQGETLAIDSAKITVAGEDLFNEVKKQFDLKKINPNGGSNLTGDLNLISKIGDIVFTYTSSDSELVNPENGRVSMDKTGTVNIGVTGESEEGTFTKNFSAVLSGLENVTLASSSTVTPSAVKGYEARNVNDDDLNSEFRVDSASGWKLIVDLKEKKPLNEICLYEAEGVGKIGGFSISLSEDGKSYTTVYTGTEIVSGSVISVPTQFARYIKTEVTSVTDSVTGLKEIYAYLKQTDKNRAEYDLNEIIKDLEMKVGSVVPQKGVFGSEVSISTDNPKLSSVQEGDSWKLVSEETDEEMVVKVTLSVKNGTETVSKVYNVILLANTNPRDNRPIGSSGNKKNSGGSVSGSGVYMPSVENGVQDNAHAGFEQELEGHWGKNEIMTLVREGIVSGDGDSLQLKSVVTRAEFLKMLLETCKFEKVLYDGDFADVTNDMWYADYAQTAKHCGIMLGDGTHFRGDEPITRQEMAVVLVGCIKLLSGDLPKTDEIAFIDVDNIAEWAKESVKTACGLALLKGYDTGEFLPTNNLLRDEAMVVTYRVLSNFVR